MGLKIYFPIELIWIDADMQASREGSGSTLRKYYYVSTIYVESVGTDRQP